MNSIDASARLRALVLSVTRWSREKRFAALLALTSTPFALPQTPCIDPVTCGQWSGPFELDIRCTDAVACPGGDEIGHAFLIPAGVHKGRVLVWTGCDTMVLRESNNCGTTSSRPYTSHIIDATAATPEVVETASFTTPVEPALPGVPSSTGQDGVWDGPFCSGHIPILDANNQPKLLVVGGLNHVVQSDGKKYGSRETYWFDPLATPVKWSDGPDELPDQGGAPVTGTWYAGVATYKDPSQDRFIPIAVGGTARVLEDTVNGTDQFTDFWRMSLASSAWSLNGSTSTYKWHMYPRLALLTGSGPDYPGEILSAGHDHTYTEPGGWLNPCRKIDTSVVPQTIAEGHDPNGVTSNQVEAWNKPNVIVIHRLKSGWQWNATNPIAEYDLNRVVATMGSKDGDLLDGSPAEAYGHTLQYDGSAWVVQNPPPSGHERVYSNAVVIPDGSILVVGGQSEIRIPPLTPYRNMVDRFDPVAESWNTWATTNLVTPLHPTPRGYHSVALLLADGSLALMGGHKDGRAPFLSTNPEDTIEVFKPPYFFNGSRPVLNGAPNTLRYGQAFCITQPVSPSITRFCLIAPGSVTHHFSFGQRYVELMWSNGPVSNPGCAYRTVMAPPEPSMAPEGYYLLFAVDNAGRASLGKFVKLTF